MLAAELGTTLIVDSDHRRDTTVSSLGAIPAIDDAVFAAAAGDVVGPLPAGARGVVVVRVADLQLADTAGLAAERESLRARLMAARAGRLLRASLNERRRELAILRSVGARPGEVFLLLSAEGLFITVLGAVLGVALLALTVIFIAQGPPRHLTTYFAHDRRARTLP